MFMSVTIIGIDCATQPRNVGVSRGVLDNGSVCIEETHRGSKRVGLLDTICDWIKPHQSTLIAMDAPLGWPISLGKELYYHDAGELIRTGPDQLFHRTTDDFIHRKLRKKPLEVGASFIARTAHSALRMLNDIRDATGRDIPLAWEPIVSPGVFAIEVYPAATLITHKINNHGYKKKDGMETRRSLLRELGMSVDLPADKSLLENNSDALDAVVCVLAGADFLRGDVYKPTDLDIAKKEGWIWVKRLT
jgi:predicted RNase H-like nuclease